MYNSLQQPCENVFLYFIWNMYEVHKCTIIVLVPATAAINLTDHQTFHQSSVLLSNRNQTCTKYTYYLNLQGIQHSCVQGTGLQRILYTGKYLPPFIIGPFAPSSEGKSKTVIILEQRANLRQRRNIWHVWYSKIGGKNNLVYSNSGL